MTKSKRDIVEDIIERMDDARLENDGGYPCQYEFVSASRKTFVAIATVYSNDPELILMDINEFIEEYDYWLD